MAIKVFLAPALLGAAGTTTIALPSAWAYGKGKSNAIENEIQSRIEKLKGENEKIKEANDGLREVEQKEKDEADSIRQQSEEKQKEIDSITKTNKTSQEKYTKAWADHNTLWEEHQKFKKEKEEADQESNTLRAKVTSLEEQLTNAKQETSDVKTQARNNRDNNVFNRVQQEIEKLEKSENQSSLYSYLKDRIGNIEGKLTDIEPSSWKCREITWGEGEDKEGIAYCVIS